MRLQIAFKYRNFGIIKNRIYWIKCHVFINQCNYLKEGQFCSPTSQSEDSLASIDEICFFTLFKVTFIALHKRHPNPNAIEKIVHKRYGSLSTSFSY